MSINFRASPSGHFKLLDESLKLFDEKSQHFKLRSSNGYSLNIPMRFKMLSTLLSDIFDSFPVIDTGVKTIILPDCNHVHAKQLLDLLTEGHTQTPTKYRQGDIQFVKDGIIDVAEILGIDIKNLAYDEQKDKELEDGEIIDDYDESRNELTVTQEVVNRAKVKIASFAAADIFSPNIVTHDIANNNSPHYAEAHFKCDLCNYAEKTQSNLNKHMEICPSGHWTLTGPEDNRDIVDRLRKDVHEILQEISPNTFRVQLDKFLELEIHTQEKMTMCLELMLEKAVTDEASTVVIVKMFRRVQMKKVSKDGGKSCQNFRKLLVLRCQVAFENDATNVGYIRLIGEMYKEGMLTARIIHECIKKLLVNHPDENSLECLCKLFAICGRDLNVETQGHLAKGPKTGINNLKVYFKYMRKLLVDMNLSHKITLVYFKYMKKLLVDMNMSHKNIG